MSSTNKAVHLPMSTLLGPRTIRLSATHLSKHNCYLSNDFYSTPEGIRTLTLSQTGLSRRRLPIAAQGHSGHDRPWSCNLRFKRPLLCHLSYVPIGYTLYQCTRRDSNSQFCRVKSPVPYQLGDGCIYYNFDNRLYKCFRFMNISPFLKISNPRDGNRTHITRVWTGCTRRYTTLE